VETRSTVRRSRRRPPPSPSSLVVGLVVVLLATVPVLVPLLVTRSGGVDPVAPGLAAAPGLPALPRSGESAEPAGTTSAAATAPVPAAGSLAGTTVPAPTPTTSAPTSDAPDATRPGPSPSPAASTSADRTPPPPATLVAEPDLVLVSVSWSPEQPATGQPVTFTAVVRNAGTEATPEVTHGVGFSVDGTPTTWSSAESAPLAPGEQRTYTADGGPAGSTWTAVAGEHELQAYVDDVDRIGETDDGNNVMTVTLTVP
jgi:hypothetical protein